MEILTLINIEGVSDEEAASYKAREAARAVVFDEKDQVALLHGTRDEYYKLPGGGIEAGEDRMAALARECLEEIGCRIEVIGDLGSIVEYRKKYSLKQTSYCYLSKLKGEKGQPRLEEGEIAEGFVTEWMPLNEALEAVARSRPDTYEGPYMVARDRFFLEAAVRRLRLV
jgi:8-oxo-dGTP pyrophosphatase MutT (NUDIX family)